METEVFKREEKEISSETIGEYVMEKLKGLDMVAYVRFASVYRERINRWRMVFMFVAVVLLVFIFWGGKAFDGAQWFIDIRQKLYNFLWYDIVLLAAATFAKLFSAMRYNNAVRKL